MLRIKQNQLGKDINVQSCDNFTKNAKTQLLLNEYLAALENNQGCCVLHAHTDLSFWEQFSEIIPLLPSNVRHIYFEASDPNVASASDINDFENNVGFQFPLTGALKTVFLKQLKTFFEDPDVSMENQTNFALVQNYGLGQLLAALTKTTMSLYCVDHPGRIKKDNLTIEERNDYMSRCIKHLNKKLQPDEKYLVITGIGHHKLVDSLNCAYIVHTSFINVDDEKDIHFNMLRISHDKILDNIFDNEITAQPMSTIIPSISLFQPKQEEKLIAPEYVFTPDVINKIEDMQRLTKLGITLEVGKQINNNKIDIHKRPTIRLKINIHSDELVNQIFEFLSKNRSQDCEKHISNKDTKIKIQSGILECIFRTNKAFKQYLNELYDFVMPETPLSVADKSYCPWNRKL